MFASARKRKPPYKGSADSNTGGRRDAYRKDSFIVLYDDQQVLLRIIQNGHNEGFKTKYAMRKGLPESRMRENGRIRRAPDQCPEKLLYARR
jgi:hypothetical protein